MLKLISIIVPLSIPVLFAACENANAYQVYKDVAKNKETKKKLEDINRFLNIHNDQ